MQRKNLILIIIGAIALIAVTAGASAYVTRDVMKPEKKVEKVATKKTTSEQISWNESRQQAQPQPQQVKKCDDGNIVGAGIGAAAGGLVGNQFGKGKGNDLATIGGIIVGGTAGHQMIPTRGVLCR